MIKINNNLSFLLCLIAYTTCIHSADKSFVFIIPSYNNASQFYNEKTLVEMNLESIFKQDYDNYRIIYYDDASTDNTEEKVRECCIRHNKASKVTYIRNTTNCKSLYGICNSIHSYCKDTDIVIFLDGDDWLADRPDILTTLNNIYQNPDIWLTTGEFYALSAPDGSHAVEPYSEKTKKENTFRDRHFYFTALRTFYAKLFKQIKFTDFLYDDAFFQYAWDLPIAFPLLEMAGSHAYYNSTIFYIYNNILPTNDHAQNPRKQIYFDFLFRNRERYQPLETLFDTIQAPRIAHFTFVNEQSKEDAIQPQLNIIYQTFPIIHTLACLTYRNNHLADASFLTNNHTTVLKSFYHHSWISDKMAQNLKETLNNALSVIDADYFVITETGIGQSLPSFDRYIPELLKLSDIIIIGEANTMPKTLGLLQKYPHLGFISLHALGTSLNFRKPSALIISKTKLMECFTNESWANGSYLATLAIVGQTHGAQYAAFLPTNS